MTLLLMDNNGELDNPNRVRKRKDGKGERSDNNNDSMDGKDVEESVMEGRGRLSAIVGER